MKLSLNPGLTGFDLDLGASNKDKERVFRERIPGILVAKPI